MSNRITLERFNYAPEGTYGRLKLPSGSELFTVERPWKGNEAYESCIPDGFYRLELRESPVVRRTSGGEFSKGWEVQDVPGRTYIMIHPGNWPSDFKGCIGVGLEYQIIDGRQAVSNSRGTFRVLMEQLSTRNDWELVIHPFVMEYP